MVTLALRQPAYRVKIVYDARARQLAGAKRVWAHVGHSGWQDTRDVELFRQPSQSANGNGSHADLWVGEYEIPAGRLPSFAHLEVQVVFKGDMGYGERWDNNGGNNWSAEVELSPGQGLVTGPKITHCRSVVSSLLLRLEAFTARRLLSPEQTTLLRTLAWCHDFALLKMYDEARSGNWDDNRLVGAFKARCGSVRRPGLHVIHVAAEMAPIAKVGGLADVVTSLAKAHQMTGTLAEVILPKYDCIKYTDVQELRQLTELGVPWGDEIVRTVVWSGVVEGLPVYFIEPHSKHKMFWRGRFYGEADDAARFLFFSRAALEFLLGSGKQPDVLHVHDWQSAAIAPLLKEQYRAAGLAKTGVVLTIHNIAFQGWLTPNYLDIAGLDKRLYHPERLLDDSRPGFLPGQHDINMLRGGVVYADKVTTVSPSYAREVFQPSFGMGLQGVLAKHAKKFSGVLNGIDHETWDPATDRHLPQQYSAMQYYEGKSACKRALLQELGLPHDTSRHPNGRPVLAVVTRLTEQKGLPLIMHGIRVAMARGAQVVLLGSAPDPKVQQQFEQMAAELSRGNDGRFVLRHDEALSHRIYAGADMILIPSAFEPCGLTQLISLRYGTVPVVRETGGLADTVHDVAHSTVPEIDRNGFTFRDHNEKAVEIAVGRAVDAYNNGWDWWKGTLVPRVMSQDFSWSRSAQDYLNLYRSLAPQHA